MKNGLFSCKLKLQFAEKGGFFMFQNKPFLCENPFNFPIISGALWFYYQLSPFSNYRCQKLDFQIPELYIYKDIFYIPCLQNCGSSLLRSNSKRNFLLASVGGKRPFGPNIIIFNTIDYKKICKSENVQHTGRKQYKVL